VRWEDRLGEGRLGTWWRFLSRDIWLIDLADAKSWRARVTRISRIVLIAGRGFFRDRCMLQAAALTYLTVFSLVPLLAFVFSVAKGFGAYNQIRTGFVDPFLSRTFGEVGEGSGAQVRNAIENVFAIVDKTDLKALGVVGILLLFWSIIKMMGAIERSLNEIWGVKRSRTLVRRVSDFLAIAIVAPLFLLIGSALSAFQWKNALGDFYPDALERGPWLALVPILVVCAGMTFILLTLPNTSVRLRSALLGGVVAGLLWQAVQSLFVAGLVGLGRWTPVYASFAAIPMFLLWLYLSWVILLIGAELSFAHQNESAYTTSAQTGQVDQAYREALAPRLAGRIAAAFVDAERPPSAFELAHDLGVAPRAVTQVLDELVEHALLARTTRGDDEHGFLPARDLDSVTVLDLLHALRREPDRRSPPVKGRLDERVDRLLFAMDEELRRSLHNYTLRELAASVGEPDRETASHGDATATMAEGRSA